MNASSEAKATQPLRLLVADDHPVAHAGLVALLEQETDLSVVFQAWDGA